MTSARGRGKLGTGDRRHSAGQAGTIVSTSAGFLHLSRLSPHLRQSTTETAATDSPIPPPVREPRRERCPLCDSPVLQIGTKSGGLSGLRFHICRCEACRFAFVADPWVDFDSIYSEEYYAGRGADPLVQYAHEVEHPDTTIRRYEWRGVLERVGSLTPLRAETSWLDYGCGAGGLVSYLRRHGLRQTVGTEQGSSLERLVERGVPIIRPEDLDNAQGTFDVITAIEVIEHVIDPVAELERMRALLRPGGLLFLTTGNARPYAKRLLSWQYLRPEIHVSFFEPDSLAFALQRAGFEPGFPGYGPGWTNIIRFKVLKSLRHLSVGGWERAVPWPMLARAIDFRLALSAHPVGWVV
jgi:SAM-dependent methyltransferase